MMMSSSTQQQQQQNQDSMQQGSAMNSWKPSGAQMPWSSSMGGGMANMQQSMVRFPVPPT